MIYKTGLQNTKYNYLTNCYETPDGTYVAAEICDGDSPSDAFRAAKIREQQRREIEAAHGIKENT